MRRWEGGNGWNAEVGMRKAERKDCEVRTED